MGEAAKKEVKQFETFQPGIVSVPGPAGSRSLFWLDRTGMVYTLRVSKRIMDKAIVDAAHDAARKAGLSSKKVVEESGLILPAK
jgi:hypothetical protein